MSETLFYIYEGVEALIPITKLDRGNVSVLPGATLVRAQVVSLDGSTVIIDWVDQVDGANGNDFANEILNVYFTAAQTTAITKAEVARFKVFVNNVTGGIWRSEIELNTSETLPV